MDELDIASPETKLDVFVVSADEESALAAQTLTRTLRENGISASFDIESRGMRNQLKQADRSGARFAAIIGGEEIANQTVTLKDLADGNQKTVTMEQGVGEIR